MQTIEEIIRLVRRPLARGERLEELLSQCATREAPFAELPDADSDVEETIFACASHVFLQTPDAPRCLHALKRLLGEARWEHLAVFLAFVRTAHYWTKVHTELSIEDDLKQLLSAHESLAECLLDDPEAGACEVSQKLMDELALLRERKQQHEQLSQAHQDLRRTEANLRDFIETATVGLHWVGPDGIVLWVNQAELDLLGYAREEYIGHHIGEFHADPPVIEDILARLTQGETLRDYEARLRAKDGSVRHVLINSSVLFENGRFVHTRCFTRDITERKQAEQALRERERSFREMIDALPAAIYTTDAEGRVTHFNPAAVQFSGRTPELGTDEWCVSWKLYRPDGTPLPHDQCPMAIALKEGRAVRGAEAIAEWPDGKRVWFVPYPTPMRDAEGKIVGGINMLVDITERKQAEEVIAQSEERFRSLVSVITDVPWTTDAEGRFVGPQAAWAAFTGQSWEEMRDFGWVNALLPEDRAKIQSTWERACSSRTLYESEGRLWHGPTKEYRYFVARATPLLNADGTVREWVGTCTDVHERRRAEEALRESDRRKDEFLATLSHELRNPLAPIRTAVDLLREAGSDATIAEQAQGILTRQVSHMTRLVDDLLELSRVTSGSIALQQEVVNLAQVVASAVETSKPGIEAAGHKLEVSLPEEPVVLFADAVRLNQILANLLNNSARYTPDGGRIRLTVRREADAAAISVRDSGIGIAPEMLPRVFDMFTQASIRNRPAHGGLGIGLSLARKLVELHGGSIEARSDGLGKGSEFVVRVPMLVSDHPAPVRMPDRRSSSAVINSRRVLVVDDNVDAAESLGTLLQQMGHEVRIAFDGQTAMEAASAHLPEIVLLDIRMPEVDGYAVAARLRKERRLNGVRIVALTGHGLEEDRRKSREAGFDEHLVKPVAREALQTLLSR